MLAISDKIVSDHTSDYECLSILKFLSNWKLLIQEKFMGLKKILIILGFLFPHVKSFVVFILV